MEICSSHNRARTDHGTSADGHASGHSHSMADPNIMANRHPAGFSSFEKIVIILAQPISFGTIGRTVLHSPPCGVIAGFDAGRISNQAHLADLGLNTKLEIVDNGTLMDGGKFEQSALGTGSGHQ
jgi:hypothetical protein